MKKIIFLLIILYNCNLRALQYPRPLATEPRIKVMNYSQNAVHVYTGYYGYQSSILFEEGEKIITISMGDSISWQLKPDGNRLFLKPLEKNADTNVTILTDRRTYHFEFRAKEATGLDDPQIAYEVKFLYASGLGGGGSRFYGGFTVPDLSVVGDKNFNYTISGSALIEPILAFDDGVYTYLKFKDIFPAIFSVDNYGKEKLINFKVINDENMIVIEEVDSLFTLRYGSDIACLFNENMPQDKGKVYRRKRGIIMDNREKGFAYE